MNTTIINQTGENIATNASCRADFSMVFAVKDLKSDNFGSLLVCNTSDEAIRATKVRLMYDQGSMIQQFPADFMLYHVGYFNTKTGVMESVGVAIPVKSILDVSLELEQERKAKAVDIPEFMKGEENVNRCEEPNSSECVESIG